MAKILMKGNEAIGEAAIYAGALNYFCYPITPQTEVAEYLAKRLPEVGGVFMQAESEVAASNMLYGAAGAGVRVFTSSSSPGISLMSEALSYIAGAQLPCVLINIIRGGPGLGGILPAQSDYNQATKAAGHGDFRLLVLAPASVQEAVDLIILAFDLADKYRNPIMVVGDGMIGQMMEPVEFKGSPVDPTTLPRKEWASDGCGDGPKRIINSLYLDALSLERNNLEMKEKYDAWHRDEKRWETFSTDKPYDVGIVAFGTVARICKTAIMELQEEDGLNVGLFRPITLYPYPSEALREFSDKSKHMLVVEMNTGQMIEDVKLAVEGTRPVSFFGHVGGVIPTPDEIKEQVKERLRTLTANA